MQSYIIRKKRPVPTGLTEAHQAQGRGHYPHAPFGFAIVCEQPPVGSHDAKPTFQDPGLVKKQTFDISALVGVAVVVMDEVARVVDAIASKARLPLRLVEAGLVAIRAGTYDSKSDAATLLSAIADPVAGEVFRDYAA